MVSPTPLEIALRQRNAQQGRMLENSGALAQGFANAPGTAYRYLSTRGLPGIGQDVVSMGKMVGSAVAEDPMGFAADARAAVLAAGGRHRRHADRQRLRRRQPRHRVKEPKMPKTRVILELGTGNDLHGSDYTKAALRAVQDALHHSSLAFIRSLKIDKTKLDVEVTIGVQKPEKVDLEKVKASLPVGNVTVKAVKGGLDIADPENNDPAVIASAAIAVRIEVA